MVKAQEWLDFFYPKGRYCLIKGYNLNKKREEVTELNIGRQRLEGSLNLSDFSSLEKLYCSNNQLTSLNLSNCRELTSLDCAGNPPLTNLDLNNCQKLERLIGNKNQLKTELDRNKFPKLGITWSINAQAWLDENYPSEGVCLREKDEFYRSYPDKGKTRQQITKLNINQQYLEGSLSLIDFDNLKELECFDNYLTRLTINNCSQLERINCWNNNLSNLDFLTTLSQLEKLEELNISNNPLTGSLKPLQNLTKLKALGISNSDLNSGVEYLPESLERINYATEDKSNCKLLDIKDQLDSKYWVDIHEGFIAIVVFEVDADMNNYGEIRKKEWVKRGFSKEQTKEWIKAGAKPDSAEFLNWYLNIKKLDLNWALANEEEFSELRDSYWSFRTCPECHQTNTGINWCQSCNAQHFQAEFNNWTSGNRNIDKFIQRCQLEATSPWNVLEWIPYEQFTNIEHLAQGGFGKVEKAEWEEGVIAEWNTEEKYWGRKKDYRKNYRTVALKTLANSNNLDKDFLPELMLYKMFKSSATNMVPCYGISKDKANNYIMVMEFMESGNLKEYLKKNYQELNFERKLHFLQQITTGLKGIHRKGLVHQDFHSGNIIVDKHKYGRGNLRIECKITDLGLCRPADETNNNNVYGVLPYVAPEVLCGQPYTQASDIYSLGIIMYEVLTGLPPFYNLDHDINLALAICQEIRPQFPPQVKYPQLIIDLIKRSWNNEPKARPTAREINQTMNNWFDENNDLKTNTLFYQQYQEAEVYNWTLPENIRFPKYEIHLATVYHSKAINTKQITQLLQLQSGQYHHSANLDLDLNNFNLDELTIQEDSRKQSSTQAQIQIPSK